MNWKHGMMKRLTALTAILVLAVSLTPIVSAAEQNRQIREAPGGDLSCGDHIVDISQCRERIHAASPTYDADPFRSNILNQGGLAAVSVQQSQQPAEAGSPFADVPAGAYYHDAVLWALENGVTTGVTATHFEPNTTCTRGQVVTFLWRAKGCPEPKTAENPFQDVDVSSPFYKAILWAQENGITSGATPTRFAPRDTCTSAHVITFLWRANGEPAASGASSLADSYPGQYYTNAIAWADSCGILSGTGSVFIPGQNSSRANIVTYLYHDAAQ